jgi:hypothetical protein
MRKPSPIDDVLEDAMSPDAFPDYDVAASRRQIARDVAEVLMFDNAAARAAGIARRNLRAPASRFPTPHDQAARDLSSLCAQAIHRTDAPTYLAKLANTRRIDPDGALHFACLLHLADCTEGAQFWWQFAAGAGNPTAAYCMYLVHLGRGELRDAQHWAFQAAELDAAATTGHPHRLDIATAVRAARRSSRSNRLLREAVRRLTVDQDDELGRVPHPDPCLAEQIGNLADAL